MAAETFCRIIQQVKVSLSVPIDFCFDSNLIGSKLNLMCWKLQNGVNFTSLVYKLMEISCSDTW
jgi:hypothetical protein